MLKVNELMVGDWVKVDDHFSKWLESLYLRVQGLDDTLRPLIETEYQLKGREAWTSMRFGPEQIEPIPLTEDILKANGVIIEYESKWGNDYCFGEFRFSSEDNKFFKWFGETIIYFNYVHELQHALRLCGLNELADNFKIE